MRKFPLKFEGKKLSLSVVMEQLNICIKQNKHQFHQFLSQTIDINKVDTNYRPNKKVKQYL